MPKTSNLLLKDSIFYQILALMLPMLSVYGNEQLAFREGDERVLLAKGYLKRKLVRGFLVSEYFSISETLKTQTF